MWNLVRLSLAYHLKALLVAWVIALLFGNQGLVILAIVAIYLVSAEDKERRLLLQLPLPVTRARVGWARVVFPAMIVLLGVVGATLISSAVLGVLPSSTSLADHGLTVAGAARDRLFFGAMVLFFSQFLLTLGELNVWGTGHGLSRLLLAFVTLLAMLFIACAAWLVLATSGSYMVVTLGTAFLTLVLMGVTVLLFEQRPSFTSR